MEIKINDIGTSVKYNSKAEIKPPPLVLISDDDDSPENVTFNISHYIIEKNNCTCALENHSCPSRPIEGRNDEAGTSSTCLAVHENESCVKSPSGGLLKSKSEACPHSPKKVHFADACGLDLTAVKSIDPNICDDNDVPTVVVDRPTVLTMFDFAFLFEQPGCAWQFEEVVRSRRVCLENCYVDGVKSSLACFVMVNVGEDRARRVYARYTADAWFNFNDVDCAAVNSEDDESDRRYSFNLDLAKILKIDVSEFDKAQKKESILDRYPLKLNDRKDMSNENTEELVLLDDSSKLICNKSGENQNKDFEVPDSDVVMCDNCDINSPTNSSNTIFLIEFALCVECYSEQSFWDNNNNLNYKIQCKTIV